MNMNIATIPKPGLSIFRKLTRKEETVASFFALITTNNEMMNVTPLDSTNTRRRPRAINKGSKKSPITSAFSSEERRRKVMDLSSIVLPATRAQVFETIMLYSVKNLAMKTRMNRSFDPEHRR
jgi:hypothetical protein